MQDSSSLEIQLKENNMGMCPTGDMDRPMKQARTRPNRFRFRVFDNHPNFKCFHFFEFGTINPHDFLRVIDSGGKALQSTGLCDSKGVEIFEGDIVEGESNNPQYPGTMRTQIEFYAGKEDIGSGTDVLVSGLQSDRDMYSDWTWTVIGNIYQNPELLK